MGKSPVQLFAYKMNTASFCILIPSFYHRVGKSEAWHLSICVFDLEYSYGRNGITISEIKQEPGMRRVMGFTNKTKKELNHYVTNVQGWTRNTYDILNHNCQHFAQVILKFLGVNETIPRYYTNLAKTWRNTLGTLKYVPEKISRLRLYTRKVIRRKWFLQFKRYS